MTEGTRTKYSGAAMVLHWLIAAGVIANWLIRRTAKATESEEAARAIMSNHFSIGVTLWFLAIALLGVHFTGGKAPLATHLATWERWLARIVHTLFFILLLVMPFGAWSAMSQYGAPISVFGLFAVPPLPMEVNPEAAKAAFEQHGQAGMILLSLLVIHVLGTLKHTVLDKDGNLFRMLPFGDAKG
ncbi:cytochrome b/b6 domain-containing protein [uncultured Altererythrobacter sp.]|uniref:cytochrome b n=1 Tax=uncultured Altererythrobacter sp. TaxID=500840 RepID=UPI0025FCC7EE|nr:cytochrome b/b6 domain-containing protein [uncultured Altererythrobacter sp.]